MARYQTSLTTLTVTFNKAGKQPLILTFQDWEVVAEVKKILRSDPRVEDIVESHRLKVFTNVADAMHDFNVCASA